MRAFNEISHYDFENGRQGDIVKEIQGKGKDYILKVDEQEYANYLYDKYFEYLYVNVLVIQDQYY